MRDGSMNLKPLEKGAGGAAWPAIAAAAGLLACLVWSYLPTLNELVTFWRRNEDYSVGALVPLVALALVAWRFNALRRLPVRPSAWGLAALLVVEALRLGGEFFGFGSAPRYSLVFAVICVIWLAAGWEFVRRLRWELVFLLLMVPLPARLHEAVSLPLQSAATAMTVFGLELLGFFVAREGNVIRLEQETSVAVTEACSGLRMLTAFVFVAAVLAFLIERARWQRAVLVLSSVPIAVLSNAIRGVATAVFVYYVRDDGWGEAFHDGAGLAMMPLALLMLWGLLAFMRFVTADEEELEPAPAQASRVPARPPPSKLNGHAAKGGASTHASIEGKKL